MSLRQLLLVVSVIAGLIAAPARADESNDPTSHPTTLPTIELRLTPVLIRPYRAPSLGAMLAFPLTEHWWIGGGYELIQDYDAVLWTAKDTGHKPIVMSGIHAGAWYRGGAARRGTSWAAGGLVTYANPVLGVRKPEGLDGHTYVVDVGADLSLGHVWDGFRLEVFATPAWSYGNISSPAIDKNERYSGFTYRIGVALAILVGS
jgi:hypothetical protein